MGRLIVGRQSRNYECILEEWQEIAVSHLSYSCIVDDLN